MLNELRDNPTSNSAIRELDKSLKSKTCFVVAEAPQIIGEFEID